MGDANQQKHLLYCTDPPTVSNQRVIRALFIRHNMLVSFISLLSGQITCAHRHSSVNMEMHLAWVGTWHTVIPSHGWGETTHFTLFNMATSLSIIKAAYRSRCLRISILFTEQRDYVLLLIRCYIMWPIGFFLILPALRGDWCISTLCHTSKPCLHQKMVPAMLGASQAETQWWMWRRVESSSWFIFHPLRKLLSGRPIKRCQMGLLTKQLGPLDSAFYVAS